ncbi:HAD-IB family hydrolase [Clostridium sp. UBA4548]|uniref:HAD-IB family hydrolase n=1 Tax=Clostridium sp. UBA4548 TaxID=1946361 RepID=UPI0025C56659|nr:HAD-IB family hydrolase [Clostridium sp. UBA4548]
MEKLAIFDIDFTLTKKETSIELYKYMLKKDPKLIKHLPKHLITLLLYGMKFYDEKKSKEAFLRFLDGVEEKEVQRIVKDFYREKLSTIIYEDAIKMIKKLKNEGYKIYLISASGEFYLNELYNIKEVDKIIGTRFKVENGVFKSLMEGANCKGEEKIKRLMEELKKDNVEVDFKSSYMFSDSLADLPLLNLVGKGYLINYKGKHDLEILRWK